MLSTQHSRNNISRRYCGRLSCPHLMIVAFVLTATCLRIFDTMIWHIGSSTHYVCVQIYNSLSNWPKFKWIMIFWFGYQICNWMFSLTSLHVFEPYQPYHVLYFSFEFLFLSIFFRSLSMSICLQIDLLGHHANDEHNACSFWLFDMF